MTKTIKECCKKCWVSSKTANSSELEMLGLCVNANCSCHTPQPAEGEMIQLDESSEMCSCFFGHEEGKECPCKKCHPGNSPSENEGWRDRFEKKFGDFITSALWYDQVEEFISQVEKEAEARGRARGGQRPYLSAFCPDPLCERVDCNYSNHESVKSVVDKARRETLAEIQKFVEEREQDHAENNEVSRGYRMALSRILFKINQIKK